MSAMRKPPSLPGAEPEVYRTEARWLAGRRRGLGGSDAPAVLALPGAKSPYALYLDKLGLIPDAPPQDPEAAAWGHRLEDDVLDWYGEAKKVRLVRPGRFTIYRSRQPETPFASATFDGLVLDHPRGLGVVNAKTASAYTADQWSTDPPLAYQVQLAHEMLVAGATWGAIPVLIGGQRAMAFELDRDDEFLRILVEMEVRFWARIERRDPPPEADEDARHDALKRLFPRPTEAREIALPEEAEAWDQDRVRADVELKRWGQIKLRAENNLIEAIGDYELGRLPSGTMYRRKMVERAGYTVKPSSYRELRRL